MTVGPATATIASALPSTTIKIKSKYTTKNSPSEWLNISLPRLTRTIHSNYFKQKCSTLAATSHSANFIHHLGYIPVDLHEVVPSHVNIDDDTCAEDTLRHLEYLENYYSLLNMHLYVNVDVLDVESITLDGSTYIEFSKIMQTEHISLLVAQMIFHKFVELAAELSSASYEQILLLRIYAQIYTYISEIHSPLTTTTTTMTTSDAQAYFLMKKIQTDLCIDECTLAQLRHIFTTNFNDCPFLCNFYKNSMDFVHESLGIEPNPRIKSQKLGFTIYTLDDNIHTCLMDSILQEYSANSTYSNKCIFFIDDTVVCKTLKFYSCPADNQCLCSEDRQKVNK